MSWLQKKSTAEGGPWKFFISHPEIIAIAHLQAGKHVKTNKNTRKAEKIVDISDFRGLLIQLFAVSIFWAHFKKADEWNSQEENRDAFNGKLNEGEFINAVKSFCAAYGQEKISDEQIKADFHSVDCDDTGSVSLLEVSNIYHTMHMS
ncbi:EF-hand domain-containing protein [archaeon]|nr:MAG: EF-hand domain-containing protein [archaeon]